MWKNTAGQVVLLYARDKGADGPKTGDAANITAYVSLDGAAPAAATNAVTELDAANAPGWYVLSLTQAETNADLLLVTASSTTGDVEIEPVAIYTLPAPGSPVVEGTYTEHDILRLLAAALAGESAISGAHALYKAVSDNTKTRIDAITDSQGQRSGIVYDVT